MWSLGVCLYAAVEGWSPFRRTTLESTLAAILSAEPPEPQHAGPLGPLIVRLLTKDPDQRPDADEVAAALEAVAEGWPAPRGDLTAPQDASLLQEFADDSGTVRFGRGPSAPAVRGQPWQGAEDSSAAAPGPDPEEPVVIGPASLPVSVSASVPEADNNTHADAVPPKRRRRTPRLVAGIVVGALLIAGGVWLGTSLTDVDGDGNGNGNGGTAGDGTPGSSGTSPATATSDPKAPSGTEVWTARPEKDMRAVLHLPRQYVRFHEQGDADDQPRMAIFDNDEVIQVRLTQWDKAPSSSMGRAKEQGDTWAGYGDSKSLYTPTTFDGYEATLADTTYDAEGTLIRVMELVILTRDSRMYELRVDMPKGTADEKRGTAVFKGAREGLEIDP
ncbi:hypothetical protein QF026_003529 [Streptomyces aurantiacus]|nr:hypothetical protein [Streptomyces aurantiacus]